MSELSHFLPGLLNSVKETRSRAAEYQRRLARMQASAASQVTMKQLAARNRKKVLAALREAGKPIGTTAIAERTGLGYNSTKGHLAALVADGEAERQSGGKGLFMAINSEVRGASRLAGEASSREAATSTVVLEGKGE